MSLKGNLAKLQNQGVFTKVLAELESSEDKKEAADAKGKGKTAEQAMLRADVLDMEDPSKSLNNTTSEDDYNLRHLKKIAEQHGLDPDGNLSALQGTLVEDKEQELGYVKSEVWLTYLNASGGKWFWIILLTLLIICELMAVLHSYWVQIWVASTSNDNVLVGEHMSPSSMASTVIPSSMWSALSALMTALRSSMPIYNSQNMSFGMLSTASSSEQKHHSAMYWVSMYMVIGLVGVIWCILQMCFVYSSAIHAARSLHSWLL
ncbi:hypothetical protein GGI24_000450 [Coemansia furcata]|nr:hypothetical protein GGI24_000450 [Coemansia furcata]